jgi:hypothetical protein
MAQTPNSKTLNPKLDFLSVPDNYCTLLLESKCQNKRNKKKKKKKKKSQHDFIIYIKIVGKFFI